MIAGRLASHSTFLAAAVWLSACPSGRAAPAAATLFIQEYRVQGAHALPRLDVEAAVYPYLGPGRTADDVERARAALEKAYRDHGFQAVAVEIPRQSGTGGIVFLQVEENPVERLRVRGARYFSPERIRAGAASVAPGAVIDFTQVAQQMVALNRNPDLRVTPSLAPGSTSGGVEVTLDAKDTFPVHGSLELNNRYSAGTTALRLNGSLTDNNLFQLGNSGGLSFQLAPERKADAEVVSGFYLLRPEGTAKLSFLVQGTRQNSDVSSLGGVDVAGRGSTAGARAILELPGDAHFVESLSGGVDYKHFDQNVHVGGSVLPAPVTYYPISGNYSATWLGAKVTTEANAGVTFGLRGFGSGPGALGNRRYLADGDFIYFRGDLSQTRELLWGLQGFAKVQGQIANEPLLDSEEFSGGGLNTVRGYLESAAVGDSAALGTFELRSPSFTPGPVRDWRVYVFGDAGELFVNDPLPEQESRLSLASVGIGTRFRVTDRLNGSLDAALPLVSRDPTKAYDPLLTFRLWSDF